MDGNLATDVIALLQYLLPGFLSAWVFYGFTSFAKPSQFERIVQALIFTLLVQVAVYFYKSIALYLSNFVNLGTWDQEVELVVSLIFATVLGFLFSYFSNNNKFHRFIGRFNITKETSYPSEWYGVFSEKETYVVLHLDDGRRIYGWPTDWPSKSDSGHFSLQQASWLDGENEIKLISVEAVLIPAKSVIMVEFMFKEEANV